LAPRDGPGIHQQPTKKIGIQEKSDSFPTEMGHPYADQAGRPSTLKEKRENKGDNAIRKGGRKIRGKSYLEDELGASSSASGMPGEQQPYVPNKQGKRKNPSSHRESGQGNIRLVANMRGGHPQNRMVTEGS